MDINNSFLFFFSALGVFNGFILFIYFLFFAKPKHKSHIFLAFLFLFLSIRIGKSIFYYFYFNLSGEFIQIGLTACWFLGPFLFFYTKEATSLQKNKNRFLTLHILTLLIISILINFKFPWSTSRDVWWDFIIYGIHIQWFIYILISGLLIYQSFKANNAIWKRNNDFKFWFFSIYLGNVVIWITYNISPYTSYIIGAITFTIIFYLLLILILVNKKRESLLLLKPLKYGNKLIEDNEANEVIKKLNDVLREKKHYRNPNISIKEISQEIGINSSRLSQILNINMNLSFPSVISKFRIEDAKEMIISKTNYTIESIGYECGFNSKSSFYKVFKKHTGMTPSSFKKSIKDD